MRIEESNIISLDVSPGSVIVDMELAASDPVEGSQLSGSYDDLHDWLNKGTLPLRDLDGNLMEVPAQCIEECEEEPGELDEEDILPLVLGSIAVLVAIILIIVVVCAICQKNKKTEDKISPMPRTVDTGALPPTYRSMAFSDSLEGG